MKKENIKRIISIVGVIFFFTFIVQSYLDNTSTSYGEVHLFKKNVSSKSSHQADFHKHNHYECGHHKIIEDEMRLDQPVQAFDTSFYGLNDVSHILPVESTYDNIRIKVDYSNLANLPSETQFYIQNKVFPAVLSYIQGIIKVQRLTVPIIVDPSYRGKTCGKGKIVIPDEHFSEGVQDADMIFYIQSHKEDTNLLAYSSHCPQGEGYGLSSGRPTVTYMSYNMNQLQKDITSEDTMVLAKWIYMTTHELIHSLVFSPNYYSKYLLEKNPVKIIGGKPYVTAPSVLKVAQEYYGCPSIDKVPLEDQGGPTTYGFHWERKAFGNEIMTGSFLYDSILSSFTAAMFKASGWYEVVEDLVAQLTWGIGEKCQFLTQSCPKNTKEFCTTPGQRCNFDYIGTGVCSSNDQLANNCSYFQPSKTQHCTYPDEKTKQLFISSGGSWGSKSRCFDTDIASSAEQQVSSLCFDARCDFSQINTKIIFKVFEEEYTCTSETKEVEIPGKGKVTCPDMLRFCFSIAACPYSCSGKGICKQGQCTCFKGFTGEDCTIPE